VRVLGILLLVPAFAGAVALVSVDEEIAIGRQADLQARREMAVLDDAPVARYVRGIGERLAREAPGPKYAYRFTVANYREINAFALPGGPVWVHRGLIQRAGNEAQVAGAIAHEIAHVARRHAADQLTKMMVANWGLGLLGAVLGNTGGAGPAQVAAGLFTNGLFLKFNRDDERDADRVGLQIMTKAGWDGRGMIQLLQLIGRESRRDPAGMGAFLSTHPSPQDRVTGLQAQRLPRGGRLDSPQFRTVRSRLMKLSPARTLPTSRQRAAGGLE
jgi:predicted Zn-dependent protease